MWFTLYLGIGRGGGGVQGIGTQPAYAFFHPGQLKNRSFPHLFLITQNDHPRYGKHVLGCIYVFFTLFGYWAHGGGGVETGLVHKLLMHFFQPVQLKN